MELTNLSKRSRKCACLLFGRAARKGWSRARYPFWISRLHFQLGTRGRGSKSCPNLIFFFFFWKFSLEALVLTLCASQRMLWWIFFSTSWKKKTKLDSEKDKDNQFHTSPLVSFYGFRKRSKITGKQWKTGAQGTWSTPTFKKWNVSRKRAETRPALQVISPSSYSEHLVINAKGNFRIHISMLARWIKHDNLYF